MNNLVLFNKDAYNKLINEVPKYKMITASGESEGRPVVGSWSSQLPPFPPALPLLSYSNQALLNQHAFHSPACSHPFRAAVLADRLNVNGSLARAAIKELVSKGLIRPVATHHAQNIYTRCAATAHVEEGLVLLFWDA